MSPSIPTTRGTSALPDQRTPPSALPSQDIELPAIQKSVLSNGLSVWLVEHHTLPHVGLNLVLNAGTDHDPPSLPGLAGFTAEMMEAGTETMSALEIADRLDYIGAAMAVHASLDATAASLYTLTKHMGEALSVFGEIFAAPVFPGHEVERVRSQRLTSLLQQRDRPSYLANLTFNRVIFGNHPYGSDPTGTESSLKSITREDIGLFYGDGYVPHGATAIVVGDVEAGPLSAQCESVFSKWQLASKGVPEIGPVPSPQPRKIYLVDKPDAPQSEIRIGCPALPRNSPDYFPAIVVNRVLGGQFSSRINLNLRERHGYTYGAWTSFRFAKREGPFVALGAFVSDKTDRAIAELLGEIGRVYESGITEEELEFSKRGISGSFALNFETPLQIASALQSIVLYGLPDDYYQHYVRNIQSVTLEDIRTVARRYLDTSKMAIVVVGDVARIKAPIERLGIGDVTILGTAENGKE